ncbi:YdeI family protein [Robiginitalea sp. SC105]|uniref:YdeI/OmpD-associated family protein n=1 Tax=Robiginitalea sp. SC105 TaxID=2762332 RepID=UPI001C8D00E1|nr:YdeI/OmpD-associated family protein [Robiginitalea sp. SC105]
MESHYFPTAIEWRRWLEAHHAKSQGIFLVFYTVDHEKESMRWEEAVREALCFGWIDSTVKSLGNGKRRQYFCPRKPGSVWSRLNKQHLDELTRAGKMHPAGLARIAAARADGSWSALDDVENGVIPDDLEAAFGAHPDARAFYEEISWTHQKSYLYWLFQAKRETTRARRISEITRLLRAGKKNRYE